MKLLNLLHGDFFSSRKQRLTWALALIPLLVALDHGVKYWAESRLVAPLERANVADPKANRVLYWGPHDDRLYVDREIVIQDPRLTLTYVRNYDIGFSILSWLDRFLEPDAKSLTLKILQFSAVIAAAIYFWFQGLRYWVPFTLLVAGGLGNSIDRFVRGYVVDFVKVTIPEIPVAILNPWPVFNVADTCISIGGVALVILLLFEKSPPKAPAAKE